MVELDQRQASGLTVTLLYEPPTNRVFVRVDDGDDLVTQFEVTAEDAHEAFQHPFAHDPCN